MTRWVREFRLIPVVLIAIGCLLALKLIGLIFDGGYTLAERLGRSGTMVVTTVPVPAAPTLRSPATALTTTPARSQGPKPSWMQEIFNYPDVTGTVDTPKPANPDSAGKQAAAKEHAKEPQDPSVAGNSSPPASKASAEGRANNGTAIPLDPSRPISAAERGLLERLQERRQELEARARQLDIRESLLSAAEKKLEGQIAEQAGNGKAGAAERKEEADAARMKSLITMYETMKPKEAAKIFDRLEIRVLLDMASKINPRRMSEILAQMRPEAAERLTVELANRAAGDKSQNAADLPKIEGRPTGN
jgi:flagellar motility protein MotE (MotC chaperone)